MRRRAGWPAPRFLARLLGVGRPAPVAAMALDTPHRFVDTYPSNQNVLDLFVGEWSTMMPPETGLVAHPGGSNLIEDERIHWLAKTLGSLEGLDIVELGPLEGGHSCQMQRLGAQSVTAIEANARAFLKCLCLKEVFGLDRVHFRLGSFFPYLERSGPTDLIVASGVLYHMTDPLRLLALLAARTDRIYLWTHYYDPVAIAARADRDLFAPPEPVGDGSHRGSRRLYPEVALSWQGFSGGSDSYAVWLERESLLGFLAEAGFRIAIHEDRPDHVNGPAISLCATRSPTSGTGAAAD